MNKVLFFLSVFSMPMMAAELNCSGVKDCINKYEKVSGKPHYFFEKFKEDKPRKLEATGELEKIEETFTFFLNQKGFTRVAFDKGNYYVVPARDIRYTPTRIYQKTEISEIPKTFDYFMLDYELRNGLISTEITRSFRPFMSRYGRIIDVKAKGRIIFQDTGANIHRMVKILESVDVPFSKDELKQWEKDKKYQRKLNLIQAKHPIKR